MGCRSSVETPRPDRISILSAVENMDMRFKKRTLPKKIVQFGMVSVAGVCICLGFGIMAVAKGSQV